MRHELALNYRIVSIYVNVGDSNELSRVVWVFTDEMKAWIFAITEFLTSQMSYEGQEIIGVTSRIKVLVQNSVNLLV